MNNIVAFTGRNIDVTLRRMDQRGLRYFRIVVNESKGGYIIDSYVGSDGVPTMLLTRSWKTKAYSSAEHFARDLVDLRLMSGYERIDNAPIPLPANAMDMDRVVPQLTPARQREILAAEVQSAAKGRELQYACRG